MNVKGMDKAHILCALYERARPQGMGFLHFKPGPLPYEEAQQVLEQSGYVDYLHGQVIKTQFDVDYLDFRLYDRDNGIGAGEAAVLDYFTRPGAPSMWEKEKQA